MKKTLLLLTIVITTAFSAHTDDPLTKSSDPISIIDDKIDFYGDVRVRHQEIYYEGNDNKYQQRYRIRMGVSYDITDDLIFVAQTSSGRGNPTSGNVKFTDGLSIDKFKVDVLDLEYKFDKSWLRAGKSKHYFYRPMKTQLIWDNDIRPEGVTYGYKDGDRATGGVWKVHRDEGDNNPLADDIYYFAAQYIKKLNYNESTTFNLGGGYHHYEGVKGNIATYKKGSLGNSLNENMTYQHDYRVLELTGEVQFKDVLGKPFKFATVLAYNTAVGNDNLGYDFSFQWGSAKKNNLDWQLGYTYRDVPKNAVYGAHNDSDFIGGGTDGKGHIFTGKMKLNPQLYTAFHYQISDNYKQLDQGTEVQQVSEKENADYTRLMVDLILKF